MEKQIKEVEQYKKSHNQYQTEKQRTEVIDSVNTKETHQTKKETQKPDTEPYGSFTTNI